jgi:hypothetical protein
VSLCWPWRGPPPRAPPPPPPPPHRAGGPAVIVVEIAFDPAEQIPPYSERPDEIRARFRL